MDSAELLNYQEVTYQEVTVLGVLYNIGGGLHYYVFTFSKNMKKYCSGLTFDSMYATDLKYSSEDSVTKKRFLGILFNIESIPIENYVSP